MKKFNFKTPRILAFTVIMVLLGVGLTQGSPIAIGLDNFFAPARLAGAILRSAGTVTRAESEPAPPDNAILSSKTWAGGDGGGSDPFFWTSNGNWEGIGGAGPGDDLIFPAGPAGRSGMFNDFATNTSFNSMSFPGSDCAANNCGYVVTGNQIFLVAGVSTNTAAGPLPVINPNIILAANQNFANSATNPSPLTFNGVVNLNGHTLTLNPSQASGAITMNGLINGTGTLTKTGTGTLNINGDANGFGTTNLNGGTVNVGGTLGTVSVDNASAKLQVNADGATGRIDLNNGTLQGTGATAAITVAAAGVTTISPGDSGGATGTLTANGTVSLTDSTTYRVDLNGPSSSDRLNVSGAVIAANVILNNADLDISLGFTPAAGQQFTIVSQTGTGAISGQFSSGSSISVDGFRFNITYSASSVVLTASPSITGTVIYGNAIGVPSPRPVSNVLISAAGSVPLSTVSDGVGPTVGQYSLLGFGTGAYTITPTKTGGVNGVTSFDAAKIAQHVAGTSLLTGNQLLVADVSGNGNITSFDAAQIANFVVVSSPSGSTGTWKFAPASNTHSTITADITSENYAALLMGEVSGNWTNTGARPGGGRQLQSAATGDGGSGSRSNGQEKDQTAVTAPRLVTPADNEVLIPVSVEGIADKGIISYEFDLRYDPSVIQPQTEPVDVVGSVSRALSVAVSSAEPGLLKVAVYGPTPINSNGVLLKLRFTAIGAPESVSPLTWERLMLNEGEPQTMITDGQVELSAPTTQNKGELNGRVLTAMGQGVPNARVTLTDTSGQSHSLFSNAFGVYRFGGLQVGQTYTIRVESRRFTFTPLTVSITDQLSSVDMVAMQ